MRKKYDFFSLNNGDHLGLWLHLLVTQKTTKGVKMSRDFLGRQISNQANKNYCGPPQLTSRFDTSAPLYPLLMHVKLQIDL